MYNQQKIGLCLPACLKSLIVLRITFQSRVHKTLLNVESLWPYQNDKSCDWIYAEIFHLTQNLHYHGEKNVAEKSKSKGKSFNCKQFTKGHFSV